MSIHTSEDVNTQIINNWLVQNNIHYRTMHRDFSDAFLVATILKRIHPTLVDMNNYPKRSNTDQKRINWDTLNSRVLARIGLRQSRADLDRYATCTPGAVINLLNAIMKYQKSDPVAPQRRFGSNASQVTASRYNAATGSRHSTITRHTSTTSATVSQGTPAATAKAAAPANTASPAPSTTSTKAATSKTAVPEAVVTLVDATTSHENTSKLNATAVSDAVENVESK